MIDDITIAEVEGCDLIERTGPGNLVNSAGDPVAVHIHSTWARVRLDENRVEGEPGEVLEAMR